MMKIDLNLLRVFDVLMEVRSVGRAADRLGLTQSAVSHALGRLRHQLDDPLFVRARGGLRPTPRSSEIAPSIRDGLSLLRDAFSNTNFDPASATRIFTISASAYFCATILPIVIQRARAEAPLAHFRILDPSSELLPGLDEGTIDLALGSFGRAPGRLIKSALFTEHLVWVGQDGADKGPLSSRPQLAVIKAQRPSEGDELMTRGSLEQRIGVAAATASSPTRPSYVTIHDSLSAGAFVSSSDLVALVPRQLAKLVIGATDTKVLDAETEESIELSMLWHGRSTSDPAHVWLRGLIEAAAGALTGSDEQGQAHGA